MATHDPFLEKQLPLNCSFVQGKDLRFARMSPQETRLRNLAPLTLQNCQLKYRASKLPDQKDTFLSVQPNKINARPSETTFKEAINSQVWDVCADGTKILVERPLKAFNRRYENLERENPAVMESLLKTKPK
jgi:hypothetical protein